MGSSRQAVNNKERKRPNRRNLLVIANSFFV